MEYGDAKHWKLIGTGMPPVYTLLNAENYAGGVPKHTSDYQGSG